MPRNPKPVLEFGPRPLLGKQADSYLKKCDAPEALRAEYRAAAMPLVRLVLWPQELADAETAAWFPRFYAKHPLFTLRFMAAMREEAERLTPAEHYLRSFDHLSTMRIVRLTKGRITLDETRTEKEHAQTVEKMTGRPVTARSFETARSKIVSQRKR